MTGMCEQCLYYDYDEEFDDYMCAMSDCMDEDEVFHRMSDPHRGCPYFRAGDEYTIVRRQN